MDTIFKFWLGHTKKMTYPHPLNEVGIIIKEFTPDIRPLQFTGFKDKKDSKLFNGDIISFEYFDDKGFKQKTYNQIFWSEYFGQWHVDISFRQNKTLSQELYDFLIDKECKLVGNIYENPELLIKNE